MKTFQQLMEDQKEKTREFMDHLVEDSSTSASFSGNPYFHYEHHPPHPQGTPQNLQPNSTMLGEQYRNRDTESWDDAMTSIQEKFKHKMNASFGSVGKWQQDAYSVFASSNSNISSFTGSLAANIQNSICDPATLARQRTLNWAKNNPQQTTVPSANGTHPNDTELSQFEDSHIFKVPQTPIRLQSNTTNTPEKTIRNIHDWHFYKTDSGFHLGGKCAYKEGKIRCWMSRPLWMYNLLADPSAGLHRKSLISDDGQCILQLRCFQPFPNADKCVQSPAPRHPKFIVDSFENGFPNDWRHLLDVWSQYIKENEPINFKWPQGINVPVDKAFSMKKYITDTTNEEIRSNTILSASVNDLSSGASNNRQTRSKDRHRDAETTSPKVQKVTERPCMNISNSETDIAHSIRSPTQSVSIKSEYNSNEIDISCGNDMSVSPLNLHENNKTDSSKKLKSSNTFIQETLPIVTLTKAVTRSHSNIPKETKIITKKYKNAKTKQPNEEFSRPSRSKTKKTPLGNEAKHLSNWWPSLVIAENGECNIYLQGNIVKVKPNGSISKERHTTTYVTKYVKKCVTTAVEQCYTLEGGIDTSCDHDIPLPIMKILRVGFPPKWRILTKMWGDLIGSNKKTHSVPKKTTYKKNNKSQLNKVTNNAVCNQMPTSSCSLPLGQAAADDTVLKQSSRGRILYPSLQYWTGEGVLKNRYNMSTAKDSSTSQHMEDSHRKSQNKGSSHTTVNKSTNNVKQKVIPKKRKLIPTITSKKETIPSVKSDASQVRCAVQMKKQKSVPAKKNDAIDFETLLPQLRNGRRQMNRRQQLQVEEVVSLQCQGSARSPDMFSEAIYRDQLVGSDTDNSFICSDFQKLASIKTPTRIGTPEARYCVGLKIPDLPMTPDHIAPLTTKERKDIIDYGRQRDAELKVKLHQTKPIPQKKCSKTKSLPKGFFEPQIQEATCSSAQNHLTSNCNYSGEEIYSDTDPRVDTIWDEESVNWY